MNNVLDALKYFEYFLIQKSYVQDVNYMFAIIVQHTIQKRKYGHVEYV